MANTPENGKPYLIRTKTGADTGLGIQWETVVCLTSVTWTPTENAIATNSKCTDGWNASIQGDRGWSISGDAQAIIVGPTDSLTASWKKYATLWKAGSVFDIEIYHATTLDLVVRGKARVSDIPLTLPNNDLATFSITFEGQGEPFFEPED